MYSMGAQRLSDVSCIYRILVILYAITKKFIICVILYLLDARVDVMNSVSSSTLLRRLIQ